MNGDPATSVTIRQKVGGLVWRYLSRFDEGEVIRWAFRGMLIGTIGVLALDLSELVERNGGLFPPQAIAPSPDQPILPPAVETSDPAETGVDPRQFLTVDEDRLKGAMRFTLGAGGVLAAEGTIDPGAATRFAEEIAARGEYVTTVALNSPGGSLDDAMAMARLIRDKELGTEVADGALCASSCPLVFAGGATRRAGEKAAIGVHQFYSAGSTEGLAPAQAMSDAQATTARITRLLAELDVDPAMWLHALDTPPRQLYYFSREELESYRIVTGSAPVAARK
ncbi:hypothetical protein [Mesorhizobium australicum]|uniref:ATP-dependent Clp protease proteolytic subunit n=1 Tax=Mesorhizobium australicum TaxID=536018 RepID=A0A1X7PY91_9HYPH|nr:hypothetical protein [Mesorhizobium australicum]SMH56779.1 hypothetical protein SAMN02982922_5594 [Mesorhizobium australicum]